jgi:hypothetical protein
MVEARNVSFWCLLFSTYFFIMFLISKLQRGSKMYGILMNLIFARNMEDARAIYLVGRGSLGMRLSQTSFFPHLL